MPRVGEAYMGGESILWPAIVKSISDDFTQGAEISGERL